VNKLSPLVPSTPHCPLECRSPLIVSQATTERCSTLLGNFASLKVPQVRRKVDARDENKANFTPYFGGATESCATTSEVELRAFGSRVLGAESGQDYRFVSIHEIR
jgi:hypothetical protein